MKKNYRPAKDCRFLVKEYRKKCKEEGKPIGKQLKFEIKDDIVKHLNSVHKNVVGRHVSENDIHLYNPTKLITIGNKKYLAIRVEAKVSEESWRNEITSHVYFFEQSGKFWKIIEKAPHLHLQDPFHAENVQGWNIFGGVKVFKINKPWRLGYRTAFYRYKESFSEIEEPFFLGPAGMKDIRMIELKNGKIGIFTRPQMGRHGLGKIGYVEIDRLEDLSQRKLKEAKIIRNQFAKGEWGGVNDLHLLPSGHIAVLGHVAYYEKVAGEKRKNYFAMTFVFDPKNQEATQLKVIASAKEINFDLPKEIKTLGNVIFGSGMIIKGKNRVRLYAGINDATAAYFELDNPFSGYSY